MSLGMPYDKMMANRRALYRHDDDRIPNEAKRNLDTTRCWQTNSGPLNAYRPDNDKISE
jgi:hypothetical protein